MQIQPNQFFNPEDCPWEVLGFFEEYIDAETYRGVGFLHLSVSEAPRPLGSAGQQEKILTEPLTLVRGMKTVTVNASKKRPLRVLTMVQIKCGRAKQKAH